MRSVFKVLIAIAVLLPTAARATPHPEVWLKASPSSARVIDPTQSSQKATPVRVQLPENYDIKNPFVLSSTGFEYVQGQNQKPFQVSNSGRFNGIYLGFQYQGKLL